MAYGADVDVCWITAFIDRCGDRVAGTVDFWCAVCGCSLSPWRGDDGEFATLAPVEGADAHLRVQRTSGTAGSHIDLHVTDVRAGVDDCVSHGAEVIADHGGYVVLSTPGDMPFCVVAHHGERRRQAPVALAEGQGTTIVDQVCIDADPQVFDDELRFWSAITGWRPVASRSPEFTPLDRPSTMPLRLMLQRRSRPSGTTGCHLDFACDDVEAAVAAHQNLGASVVSVHHDWTVMTDPSGTEYCLTRRRPAARILALER